MQPTSKTTLDAQKFALLRNSVKNVILSHRRRQASSSSLPPTLGIKLTNRCNLRCAHCYQWNDTGYHRHMTRAAQSQDLDIRIFEKVLEQSRESRSRLYLWGGEPLVHRNIVRILELLANDPREVTICTNAYYIGKHLDRLCAISEGLELLIAVEGFEVEHDRLRGENSFRKVMEQIDKLIELRASGEFKGKISIHSVINPEMIGRLYELMCFFEKKGVDLVLLCFPWYISDQTSAEMTTYIKEHLNWAIRDEGRHSWDAFNYHIDADYVPVLMADLKRINARTWSTTIRYQPGLEFNEIEDFVRGQTMTARCATQCSVLNTRADVTPDGAVSACKFFSEFNVGNLHDQSLEEIWNSERYAEIRDVLGRRLTPACSKCNVLYLHAHSTPMHI